MVPPNQRIPLHVEDWDYIRVLIGARDEGSPCASTSPSSFPLESSDEDLHDLFSGLQMESHDFLHRRPLALTEVDPLSFSAVCISSDVPSSQFAPKQMSANQPFSFFEGHGDRASSEQLPGRPPRVDRPIWYQEIWDMLDELGSTEMAEEGPVIYFNSHFVSHSHHPRCLESRSLRFDSDHETAGIRFM